MRLVPPFMTGVTIVSVEDVSKWMLTDQHPSGSSPKKRKEQKNDMKRFVVRKSSVHGNGVFALRPLKAGELLLEYKGEIIA